MKTLLPSNENYTDLISFSGGRTSAYLAYLAKQNFKKPLFVFIDTGFEHPKTYEFIKNVDKAFNLNLVCIQSVISQKMGVGVRHKIVDINDIGFKPEIFTDYVTKNGSPVCVGATCSDRMKEKAFHSFAVTNEIRDLTTWLGMRVDEPRRLKGKKGIDYLASISDYDKEDILEWWSKQSFDLELDEHLGNCVFCVKKSAGKIALAQRDEPELFEKWVEVIDASRIMPNRAQPNEQIYRNSQTPRGIVAAFSEFSREEIANKLRFEKRYDTGSCTESCEPQFRTEEYQNDLFKPTIKKVI